MSNLFDVLVWAGLGVTVLLCVAPQAALADEYSTLSQSTVLGRTTGIPTGTSAVFAPANATDEEIGRVDFITEAAFYFKNMEILKIICQTLNTNRYCRKKTTFFIY